MAEPSKIYDYREVHEQFLRFMTQARELPLEPLEVPWELRVKCMRGMIEARGYWADGSKRGPGDPGLDWRREIVGKAGIE